MEICPHDYVRERLTIIQPFFEAIAETGADHGVSVSRNARRECDAQP
jgi:hypothetical protein